MTNYIDSEEDQEIIYLMVLSLESDEETSFSPSMTISETKRTYSPQIIRQQYQLEYSLKKIQSPIIGFKLDCWTIQPFSLDEQDQYLDGDLILKCKEQLNSRNIQNLFEKGDDEFKEYIFFQILSGITQLANDIFWNYVVQRILEQGNVKQRDLIFDQLSQSTLILSYYQKYFKYLHNLINSQNNTYGCRMVQKLLEIFYNTDKFEQIFTILLSQIRILVLDINGNHVIQKLAELMKSQKINWLIQGVLGQI